MFEIEPCSGLLLFLCISQGHQRKRECCRRQSQPGRLRGLITLTVTLVIIFSNDIRVSRLTLTFTSYSSSPCCPSSSDPSPNPYSCRSLGWNSWTFWHDSTLLQSMGYCWSFLDSTWRIILRWGSCRQIAPPPRSSPELWRSWPLSLPRRTRPLGCWALWCPRSLSQSPFWGMHLCLNMLVSAILNKFLLEISIITLRQLFKHR